MESKLRARALVYGDPDDVRRQQVAGELDSAKRQAEGNRDRMCQGRLADTGGILDQEVSAGEQAGQTLADLKILADNYGRYACRTSLEFL
jgi:hypothetical protein